jgi:hypothetical protein
VDDILWLVRIRAPRQSGSANARGTLLRRSPSPLVPTEDVELVAVSVSEDRVLASHGLSGRVVAFVAPQSLVIYGEDDIGRPFVRAVPFALSIVPE